MKVVSESVRFGKTVANGMVDNGDISRGEGGEGWGFGRGMVDLRPNMFHTITNHTALMMMSLQNSETGGREGENVVIS